MRAVALIGSRARVDHPADRWSDLDLIVVASDPQAFLVSSSWIDRVGEPWLTFVEPSPAGEATERRVIFEPGLSLDVVVFAASRARLAARVLGLFDRAPVAARILPAPLARRIDRDRELGARVWSRGVRILLDKDGHASRLAALLREPPPEPSPQRDEFENLVADFWHDCLWTVRHLRRGELWWAISGCDGRVKDALLRMLEWHARAAADRDTWQTGRFLEEWADPRAVKALSHSFARYDADDIARALLATMDLFRWLSRETADRLGFPYPRRPDQRVTEWVRAALSQSDV